MPEMLETLRRLVEPPKEVFLQLRFRVETVCVRSDLREADDGNVALRKILPQCLRIAQFRAVHERHGRLHLVILINVFEFRYVCAKLTIIRVTIQQIEGSHRIIAT